MIICGWGTNEIQKKCVVNKNRRWWKLLLGYHKISGGCVGGDGGGGVKSFSCQTQLLSWVVVELGLWQYAKISKGVLPQFWKLT